MFSLFDLLMPSDHPLSTSSALPCVVQIGFSGSRMLYDHVGLSAAYITRLDTEIEEGLRRELLDLRRELGLDSQHFFAGVSQVAIGGDSLFTRCCGPEGRSGIAVQRVLLPQPLDAYLSAEGSSGPDFTVDEREAARQLLRRPSVVHVQSVSSAENRPERFTDALHAILATSDVAVCLLRKGVAGRPGGSADFLEFAHRAEKPVRLIEVSVVNGHVRFESVWLDRGCFVLPRLPLLTTHVTSPPGWTPDQLPSAVEYCAALKWHFSPQARGARVKFEKMVRAILSTHLGATVCAAVAIVGGLVLGDEAAWVLAGVLAVEVGLLLWGRRTHHELHHGGHAGSTVRTWAAARLTAEISRSVSAIGETHMYLSHLSILRILPVAGLDRLVSTINWLHLQATASQRDRPYREIADAYLRERVDDQIAYLGKQNTEARHELMLCLRRFQIWWWCGFAATGFKLVEVLLDHLIELPERVATLLVAVGPFLGIMAVVFPVLAVGALSWAAALDLEARASEFKEIYDFLKRQRPIFEKVSSNREVRRLMIETETTLLGEVAQWYVRRAYSSVA
jgi:hypothetical protein